MFKWIILLGFCLFSSSLIAHEANLSSTILVKQEDGSWILQIRSPLTSFEYEIKHNYGPSSYSSPEEFQLLAIEHLKKNIIICFNQQDTLSLKNGFVKLGHETNAVFQVLGVPKTIKSLLVKNSSFSDINRNQSALVILKTGFAKNQFILNHKNQHAVELETEGTTFVVVGEELIIQEYSFLYAIIGLLFLYLGLIAYYRNKAMRADENFILNKK